MSTYTTTRPNAPSNGVIGIIEQVARQYDPHDGQINFPVLAIATAITESGLNPQNVGDNGTSFGLYQLHEGGELGNLTEQQAFNPATNASVALSTMSNVIGANPGLNPGQAAAAAQRPADQAAYASKVNYYYNQLLAGVPPQNLTSYSGTGTPYDNPPTGLTALTSAGGGTASGCGAKGNVFHEGGILGIGSFSFTYCNLKAITGAALMVSGGIICLIGIGTIVVAAGLHRTPIVGAAAGFAAGRRGRSSMPEAPSAPEAASQARFRRQSDTINETSAAQARGRATGREAGPFPEAA